MHNNDLITGGVGIVLWRLDAKKTHFYQFVIHPFGGEEANGERRPGGCDGEIRHCAKSKTSPSHSRHEHTSNHVCNICSRSAAKVWGQSRVLSLNIKHPRLFWQSQVSTGGRQNDLFVEQRSGFLSTRLLFFSRFLSVVKVSPWVLSVNANIHVLRDNCRALNTTRHGSECSARLVFFPPLSGFWRNSADTNIFLCVSEIITCCELYWRCLDAFGGPFFADNQFMIFLCVFCFVLFSLVPADSLNVKQWCEKHWEQSGFKKNRKQAKNAAPRSTRSSVLLKRPS